MRKRKKTVTTTPPISLSFFFFHTSASSWRPPPPKREPNAARHKSTPPTLPTLPTLHGHTCSRRIYLLHSNILQSCPQPGVSSRPICLRIPVRQFTRHHQKTRHKAQGTNPYI